MKNKEDINMTFQQKELKKLIEKRYSNPNRSSFLFLVLFIGIVMIIYGGFTKNWDSIVSGVLMIFLVLIL